MTINQIVSEQMQELNELVYKWNMAISPSMTLDELYRSFIHSYTRKLIESVAEEIIKVALDVNNWDSSSIEDVIEMQRLKVKEIINSISK